jgi:polysaccharide pyruvyl transferase WcaK-like protein
MLLGLGELVDHRNTRIVVSEHFNPGSIFAGSNFIPAWNGLAAGWKLGLASTVVDRLYVIGADVMDGYYTPGVSRQRLLLINAFAKAGITCCITGFSFNEAPSPSVVEEFKRLPLSVRVCLRDAVSLERFERIVGRSAVLVADLAFLVTEAEFAPVANRVAPWAAKQKADGRLVLGININPQVVAHLKQGTEDAIADSVAQCCKGLLQENISIVLIPHDFRPGCADLRVMSKVWSRICDVSGEHGMVLAEQFSAQEIKTACRAIDLVLSARMHLAIGALSVGTPVCGIQYQGKFEGLFKHFGFAQDIFIEPENALNPIKLKAFLNHNIDRVGVLRAQVHDYLPPVKELARLNQAAVAVS